MIISCREIIIRNLPSSARATYLQRLLYVGGVLGLICRVEPHHGSSEEAVVPRHLDKVQDSVEPPPESVTTESYRVIT